ncbi:hypothetical protein ACLOJK_035861 [Asimina triloba]
MKGHAFDLTGTLERIATGDLSAFDSPRRNQTRSLTELGASLQKPALCLTSFKSVVKTIMAFIEELSLNLTEAAWVSVLPPLASILVTSIAAPFADNLISSGVETTVVRKICQTIAFVSPAACMTISSLDLGLPHWEIVVILTSGLGLSSFALSDIIVCSINLLLLDWYIRVVDTGKQ